jgi:DNA polymerase-1
MEELSNGRAQTIMKTLYIVDSNSYAYRAFYAIPPLTTKDGVEVHAVYGFFNMLNKIIKYKQPDYLFLAFDFPGPNFRHKIYEEYKIQREKMPESLQVQMKLIREIAKAGNIKVFEENGYEADDIIAATAYAAAASKNKVFILSSDKDMIQLINKDISILKYGRDGEIILTPESVKEKYGITPGHIVDVLALMGDASDNIPGVKGIGEKTAYKLVQEYGAVEEIIKKTGSLKPDKVNKLVEAGLEDIKLSMELAVLRVDPGLIKKTGFVLDDCAVEKIDRAGLDAEFIRYNFKSLVSDGEQIKKEAKPKGTASQISSFEHMENRFKTAKAVTVLFCGNDRNPELILISAGKDMHYMYGKDFKGLPEFFSDINIVTNSSKAVFTCLGRKTGKIDDIMLQAYLLNPEKSYNDVSHVFTEYGGGMYLSYEDVSGKGAKKIMIELADPQVLSDYCSSMLETAPVVAEKLENKLKEEKLNDVCGKIEIPVSYVLSAMENTGLKIDRDLLEELLEKTAKQIEKCEEKIFSDVGFQFNINSPKQLGEVLFEKLKLPPQRKNKTGYSTDSEVLSALEKLHPVVAGILRNRMLVKLKTGFLDVIKGFLTKDNKIFPVYNQNVAATGRLSASEPNIQNIPVREDEGKEIRRIFIPLEKKQVIIKADYSQIELRIMAHFSGDKKLIHSYEEGVDIHAITASEVFGVDIKDVDQHQRRAAKTINFGIIYGISPYGLAKQLSISPGEAGEYIDKFFTTFPGVKKYQEDTAASAAKRGWVETLTGRRRYMANINSKNRGIREFAERAAVNMPIQGTAADIIKKAMIEIQVWLENEELETKMILQVHDELVFSSPAGEKELVKKEIKRMMEAALKLDVPLTVTIGEGANWGETE